MLQERKEAYVVLNISFSESCTQTSFSPSSVYLRDLVEKLKRPGQILRRSIQTDTNQPRRIGQDPPTTLTTIAAFRRKFLSFKKVRVGTHVYAKRDANIESRKEKEKKIEEKKAAQETPARLDLKNNNSTPHW